MRSIRSSRCRSSNCPRRCCRRGSARFSAMLYDREMDVAEIAARSRDRSADRAQRPSQGDAEIAGPLQGRYRLKSKTNRLRGWSPKRHRRKHGSDGEQAWRERTRRATAIRRIRLTRRSGNIAGRRTPSRMRRSVSSTSPALPSRVLDDDDERERVAAWLAADLEAAADFAAAQALIGASETRGGRGDRRPRGGAWSNRARSNHSVCATRTAPGAASITSPAGAAWRPVSQSRAGSALPSAATPRSPSARLRNPVKTASLAT